MTITVREPTAPAPTIIPQLHLDPALLERPEARLAHQRGLLTAKTEALRSATRLTAWARPLLVGVLIVSFLHLWHQIARITPEGVPALPLPAWAHWLSAGLLTASIDATALYLVATRAAAQYARLGQHGRASVWFFYLLTAALNSVFVLSYTPGLPSAIDTITPILSLIGAVLLGVLVPVSIAAVEQARQVADAARLALLVEVELLRGLVAHPPGSGEPVPTRRAAGVSPEPSLRDAEPADSDLVPESAPVPATLTSDPEAATIRTLAAQGMTRNQIAAELGGRRRDTLARIRAVLDGVSVG